MTRQAFTAHGVLNLLKTRAEYNPNTGEFICLTTGKGINTPVGKPMGHKSNTNGYLYICLAGKRFSCHALAWLWMTGDWNKGEIDHINGNREDNRWENLRDVDRKINGRNSNRHRNKRNTGVGFHKASGRWRAYVRINMKSVHLGLFDTEEEAIEARQKFNRNNASLEFACYAPD